MVGGKIFFNFHFKGPFMSQSLMQFFPILALFAIFYFLIIRPQQKAQKEHQAMLESLTKGDKIVTNGGLIVEVVKVEDDYFKVKLNDTTTAKLDKAYVAKKLD
jgi:preprotein translocase subunit YajC